MFAITGMLGLNPWKVWAVNINDFYTGKDASSAVPELPIVAMPVAVMLAIIFILHEWKKEE